MNTRNYISLVVILCLASGSFATDDTTSKTDPRYPFRTDFANSNLPWYMPKPDEFPPHHSDRWISGELISIDFIHRTCQFRATKDGQAMDFTMPPYDSVIYLNTEADLRDVPLGTYFHSFLNQDSHDHFTRLAAMLDEFSIDAGHSFTYRLDEICLSEGKLLTTKQSLAKQQPNLGKKELLVTDQTRLWKGDQPIKLADLAVGDEFLYNLTGKTAASPGVCTDIWVGSETHALITQHHRDKFSAFIKRRGLPGWIDQTDGKKLIITLFSGEPKSFSQTWLKEFGVDKEIRVVVANDELRTWNSGVDG